jgi:ABC-type Fe3+/spermidine/putrescine transport system ATPase subunit
MARVRLVNISKHYGSTVAVEKVNLDVAEGEFVTLLGPSGCGKTTTLRMVAGLIEPTEGRVLFDEQDVTELAPNTRNIGFVFQSPALFPHMSVADNIGFGLSVKGQPQSDIKTRVAEMLKLVDLLGYGDRLPRQLSGGQQQRVALARVLATDPRVLLFDEPLSALDRNLRDTLKYNILELQRRTGKTAIYVTHDQSEAFAISDRIAVMNQGRIDQIGTQTDIYLHPQSDFVAEFIGANNRLEGRITDMTSSVTTVQANKLTVQCPTRVGLKIGDAVVAYVRPEDIKVLSNGAGAAHRNVIEGTLEQIIFEGATAQLRVDVAGQMVRVDVAGTERLKLLNHRGQIHLGFDEVTLIPLNVQR